jgi:transcriptional regulator with XRE-family HTH domain
MKVRIFNGAMMAAAREKKGITRAALAKKVGCSHTHIKRLEEGSSVPSLNLAYRIAQAVADDSLANLTNFEN